MFDEIIVASHPGMNSIREALLKVGVSSEKINTVYISTLKEAQVNFLQNFSDLYKNYAGGVNVAEGGFIRVNLQKK